MMSNERLYELRELYVNALDKSEYEIAHGLNEVIYQEVLDRVMQPTTNLPGHMGRKMLEAEIERLSVESTKLTQILKTEWGYEN